MTRRQRISISFASISLKKRKNNRSFWVIQWEADYRQPSIAIDVYTTGLAFWAGAGKRDGYIGQGFSLLEDGMVPG